MVKKTNKNLLLALALIFGGIAATGYLVYENSLLQEGNQELVKEILWNRSGFFAITQSLNGTIKDLTATLDSTRQELADTIKTRDYVGTQFNLEKQKNDAFSNQINEIKGQLGTLQKINNTDPDLLKKYSKVYFLNENYVPRSFVKIDSGYTFKPEETFLFYADTWPFLKVMLDTAKADNVDLKVLSAYRSFSEQSSLKSSYKVTYGTGANKFSADQGYSEHQLGTTIDLTNESVGASLDGFDKTPEFKWLTDNAYNFGFIMSYPKGNDYYQYEPWHWRFVGRALAQKLHDEGKNFYDLDQRTIDEHRVSFFD
ncbi:MAG: M15 family metallopeptidase [Candidatus Pacebacteria bacterium]|jgi:D-alanyl-D-alanine carboxypeptidase|nr:M15 family metallopeptidase [Candidatus Paceibacterota bacterium]